MSLKAGDSYTCASCGGTFVTDWSADEALEETADVFGFVPEPADQAIVCDECFERMMGR